MEQGETRNENGKGLRDGKGFKLKGEELGWRKRNEFRTCVEKEWMLLTSNMII